jgi:hypothetical protein
VVHESQLLLEIQGLFGNPQQSGLAMGIKNPLFSHLVVVEERVVEDTLAGLPFAQDAIEARPSKFLSRSAATIRRNGREASVAP